MTRARGRLLVYKGYAARFIVVAPLYYNMARLGQLTVATFCESCGFTHGTPAGEGVNRCGDCGRFTSDDPDVCCTRHEVRRSPYSTGECPRCEQERHVRAMERDMMERRADPRMHPSVDAPRF